MDRARAAAAAALFTILLAGTVVLAAAAPTLREAALSIDAAVGWPPSTLVVSEVQTGGASASDEFAEIANMGVTPVDLAGLEIVYVTSTGGTVTKKAAWDTPLILEPGRHLVVANTSGVFAGIADATYSGGFAATGGAIALRAVGGAPVDAVAWGDATNAFVEGTAAPPPPAGSSLERRPGGSAGNRTDTNDNAADLFVQSTPNPQNLAAPPVPAPGPTATPTGVPTPTPAQSATPSPVPSAAPSPTPTPTASPEPTPSITPSPSPSTLPTPDPTGTPVPTPTPEPTTTPEPTASATPVPTPSPTPDPTPPPSPDPTATPDPTPAPTATPEPSIGVTIAIADARALPDGSTAAVIGTLTTDLGALESARAGFVEDATGGIAVYLDAALDVPLTAGTVVRLVGTLDERYEARTLRVATTGIIDLGPGTLPAAGDIETGAVNEDVEGRRVVVAGVTVGSPTSYADGTGILVDDGSGAVRVIVGPDALGGAVVPSGALVRASGPVGQRDSTGTGTSGYRIHATEPGELVVLPPPPTPTPAPTASPTPTPGPTIQPSPSPSATPGPTGTPAPSPASLTIAEVRARTVGATVTVTGVVTAEAGRLGTPSLLAIADQTGGLIIRVPEGTAAPGRGAIVAVTGPTAAPYGQLEVRPQASGFRVVGTGGLPSPLAIGAAGLGEGSEGRLVAIIGTVSSPPRKATSGDLTIDLVDANGTPFRVMADVSSRVVATDLVKGTTYRLMGVVGQRASAKGALDGYRVWVRDRADVTANAGGGAGSSPSPSGGPTPEPTITIAAARALDDAPAVVEGIVTAAAGLLDDDGRRLVIQDATGGIEVYLPVDTPAPALGERIRVAGTVGRAWDAPRLRAVSVVALGAGGEVAPRILTGAPGESLEWQLVRIAGTITDVTRLGDRWRAEVRLGGVSVLVTGLSGAGIASTSLIEGRAVTLTGIVRRPYPTATDRRWSVVPRGPWDVAVGPAGASTSGGSGGTDASAGGHRAPGASSGPGGGAFAGIALVDLATIAEHLGELVRVGGLVVARTESGFTLDDGTAIGRIQLGGDAAAFLELIEAGDALGIVGRVAAGPGGTPIIVATDPAGLVRLGSLGEMVPLAAEAGLAATPRGSPSTRASAGLGGPLGGLDGGWLGLVGVIVASAISLIVTVERRRRARRRLATVVAARLSELRRPFGRA